jgi:hypothetical protein
MNNRELPENIWKDLLEGVLAKIDKADAKDTFYICMALGKGRINPQIIKSDIYYTLYLNAARHINDFDLFQLAQMSMFLCSDQASMYVPDEYWTEALSKGLEEAISNFEKFETKINK